MIVTGVTQYPYAPTMKTRIQQLVKTSEEWDAENPILYEDEIAYVNTSEGMRQKIGDGMTRYSELPFVELYDADTVAEANKYTSTKVYALRELTVPHTTASGASVVTLTDSLAGEKLIGCKIYGSESGVGDLDSDTGKYVVQVSVHGQNLFNADLAVNSTGVFVKNDANTCTMTKQGASRFGNAVPIFIPAGVTFGISFTVSDFYDPDGNSEATCKPSFVCVFSENATTKTISPSSTTTEHFYSTVWNITNAGNFISVQPYLLGSLGSGVYCTVKDLQIFLYNGTEKYPLLKYEQYIEPQTVTAALDSPLGEGEYIDLAAKKRVGADGTETDIEVSGSLITLESAVNNVICETENAPSKLEISYYQDINKVFDELKSAVLAQGASV